MIETKKLAAELSAKITYTPADDRLLVKPLKPVMITKVVPVPPKSQPDTLDDVESSPEVSMEKKKVPANMTKGIILKLGPDYANDKGPYFGQFEIGDVVIYPTYAGINFELFKDTKMLRRYEIVATEKGV